MSRRGVDGSVQLFSKHQQTLVVGEGGGGGREAGSACVGGCGSLLELCADAVHAGSVRRQMMGGKNGLLEVSSKGCFE